MGAIPMSLLTAIVIFLVGLVSGIIIREFAGIAALGALLLVVFGVTTPNVEIVDFIVSQYYQSNELLFLAGLLFGLDANRTRRVITRGD